MMSKKTAYKPTKKAPSPKAKKPAMTKTSTTQVEKYSEKVKKYDALIKKEKSRSAMTKTEKTPKIIANLTKIRDSHKASLASAKKK
tara:strand:+ start:166 stop:423 length:258 start_codon:yes stop_codon:yes gene_type:complete